MRLQLLQLYYREHYYYVNRCCKAWNWVLMSPATVLMVATSSPGVGTSTRQIMALASSSLQWYLGSWFSPPR